MTGKELKVLVAQIPDDDKVFICGPDSGGYDWTFHDDAKVEPNELVIAAWTLKGTTKE